MSDELEENLMRFVARFNQNPRFQEMNRDWDRHIVVAAQEGGAYRLQLRDGVMSLDPEGTEPADIALTAPREVLSAIFDGRLSPTEPYMDGDLQVRGSQEDMLRLDVLTLLIWGD